MLVLLLKISLKIPKLHRDRGIKCKLRTSKNGMCTDKNWMFVDRGFAGKFFFAIEYDLFFFFISSLSAPLKFFY